MAFTRKMLKAMGIEEDKIDEIIDAHREVTDALKADRDKYKADADKLVETQAELDKLKGDGSDTYKEKYEKEHKDFEAFKKSINDEKLKETKAAAYKALLKQASVSDDWIDDIVKFAPMDEIQLDDKGNIVDADKRIDSIKEKYSKYIVTQSERGAGTEKPPANNGGKKLTREEIYAKDERGRYKLSTAERQKALAQSFEQ